MAFLKKGCVICGNPDVEYFNMQGKPICRNCYDSRRTLEVD